ncbi:hypothetical protein L9F63_015347, partial [Diploptera punctata]
MNENIWIVEKISPKLKSKKIRTFYSIIRPTTILCKIFGVFSIKNALLEEGTFLQYKRLSLDALWCPVLHLTCFFAVYKYVTFPWWLTTLPILLYRSFADIFLCIYYDKYLLDLIIHLEEFDKILLLVTGNEPTRSIFASGTTWMLTTLILFSISYHGVFSMLHSNSQRTVLRSLFESTVTITSGFAMKAITILYCLLCINLSLRFNDVSSHLKYVVSKLITEGCEGRRIRSNWNNVNFIGNNLEEIRFMYEHLSDAIGKLNRCFGVRLACFIVLCFLQMTVDFYQYKFNYGVDVKSSSDFLFYHTFSIFVIGALSENITNSV